MSSYSDTLTPEPTQAASDVSDLPGEIEAYLSDPHLSWMRAHVVGWLIDKEDRHGRSNKAENYGWIDRTPGSIARAQRNAKLGLVILTQHRLDFEPVCTLLLAVWRKTPVKPDEWWLENPHG